MQLGVDPYNKKEIEWIILDREDHQLLLVSKNILAIQPFDESGSTNQWKDSSLRKWLNSEFLQQSTLDQEPLVPYLTILEKRGKYGEVIIQEKDLLFILSNEEVEEYLVQNRIGIYHNQPASYWLRDAGCFDSNVSYISENGTINLIGKSANQPLGVRIACLLQINKGEVYGKS